MIAPVLEVLHRAGAARGLSVSGVQRHAGIGYAQASDELARLELLGAAVSWRDAEGVKRWAVPASAEVSPCGRYRYRLARRWGPGAHALWIMFNPSTADALEDDPTIRRCRAFSERWGLGALEVVNLFAWRATDPKEIEALAPGRWSLAPHLAWRQAIGPENDRAWREALDDRPELVVVAWGAFPLARAASVRHLLPAGELERLARPEGGLALGVQGTGFLHGRELRAVRLTSAGDPGHPLYVPNGPALTWDPSAVTRRPWR